MTSVKNDERKMRVTYRTRRVTFPENGKKARTYFNDLKENYVLYWCNGNKADIYQAEITFYREQYHAFIDKTNQTYLNLRHKERMINAKDLHGRAKTCPEEVFIQIGGKLDKVEKKLFTTCVRDYLRWMKKWSKTHGSHMHILNVHISNVPPYHAVIRRVWDYSEKGGMKKVSMRMALRESGVELLDPQKEETKFNNRKACFDKESRNQILSICEKHGLGIERTPGIYTVEKALEVKREVERVENAAREVLKQISEIENEMATADFSMEAVKVAEGYYLVPREYYYPLKIRNELKDAYLRNNELASEKLLSAMERENQDMQELQLLIQKRRILEYEYMSLRMGLIRCGYVLHGEGGGK